MTTKFLSKHHLLALGFIFIGILSCPAFGQESLPSPLDKKVNFEITDSDPIFILRVLAAKSRLRIGFESFLYNATEKPHSISIRISGGTVRDVLNEFVEADPRYQWRAVDGVVNVAPRACEDGILDVVVHKFSVKDVTAESIGSIILDLPEVQTRLKSRGLSGSKAIDYDGPLRTLPQFSIDLSEITVRDILNEMLKRKYTDLWTVTFHGDDKTYVTISL